MICASLPDVSILRIRLIIFCLLLLYAAAGLYLLLSQFNLFSKVQNVFLPNGITIQTDRMDKWCPASWLYLISSLCLSSLLFQCEVAAFIDDHSNDPWEAIKPGSSATWMRIPIAFQKRFILADHPLPASFQMVRCKAVQPFMRKYVCGGIQFLQD